MPGHKFVLEPFTTIGVALSNEQPNEIFWCVTS
jgi:hypothetical protein